MLQPRLAAEGSAKFGALQGSFHGAARLPRLGSTVCTWTKTPGGLPVDFHAALGAVLVRLSIELKLSKSPSSTRLPPPWVTLTLSMIAAPRVREVNERAAP